MAGTSTPGAGRVEGTERYVATDDLMVAVNAAVTLGRPLLVKGEPGTGKTVLAREIALALGRPLIEWHVKSTTTAKHRSDARGVGKGCEGACRAGWSPSHSTKQKMLTNNLTLTT